MKFLQQYIDFVDKLNEKIGRSTAWLTTALVLIICADVFARYFLKKSMVAIQELEWHLFAIIFLAAAAFTLKHDRHVRVDVLYVKFSEKQKAWVNFLGSLLFLIPLCAVIIISSQNYVWASWITGETSPDPGGLPARYALKAIIPAAFFLLFLQAVSLLFKSLQTIFNNTVLSPGDAE